MNEDRSQVGKVILFMAVVFIAILVISLIFGSFFIVGAGERGIVVKLGDPDPQPRSEGLHFKRPFIDKVIKMDVKTQKYETEATAASKDLQNVHTMIAVNFHIVPEATPEIYKTVGLNYADRLIQPSVQEVVKAATAKFTAEELITRREEVKENIKLHLKERLTDRSIIVEDISITNFDFSASFNAAIEAKVTAEQDALAAKNKLSQIEYEAQQKVVSAQAEAQALRLQKQEVTPDLIRLRQIEVQMKALDKWDGKLPVVVGQSSPFIDVTSLIQNQQVAQ